VREVRAIRTDVMWRTALLSVILAVLGWASASWLTAGFEVWTAEGARRLTVVERPVPVPAALLAGHGVSGLDLRAWLSGKGRVTIVDFIYTRCPTVCSTLGSGFQQLQQAIAARPGDDVGLLSISFDPLHDDAARLQQYASQWRADPRHWRVVTVPDAAELKRLLDAFQVIVIADGLGGYEHNAALLIVDERGRLVRIFDDTDLDAALAYTGSIARGAPE
jgi:protein SCO1/2